MEVLGDRVLYYDTDSVIYTWKPGQTEIPLGDYLGDMTNELDEGDSWNLCQGVPRTMGMQRNMGKSCVKFVAFPFTCVVPNSLIIRS